VPRDLFVMALRMDDVTGLDPAELFEFTGAEVAANIYDRLLYFDPEDVSKIVGGVAESWEVSKDGKFFRFRIRANMRFRSGNPVTAEDAAFSLRRAVLMNKAPAFIIAQFGFTPENVQEKIRAEDPSTLVIETDRAYAPSFFFACLTSAVASVVDGKLVQARAVDGDFGNRFLRTNSAGSGPFALRDWKPSELLILDRFEGHWRGTPAMKTAFIRHIAEPGVQRLLIERGDIDVARNLGPDQFLGIKDNPGLRARYARKGALYYLGLNQKVPVLREPAVRKALKYLVDYEGIATTLLRGKAEVHQTIIPAGYLGALDEKPYEWTPGAAKRLLKEAGLAQGFEVTLDVWNTRPDLDIAQSLQASFAEAGISLRILQSDGKQLLTKYRARNHEIFLGRWGPDFQDPHTNAQAFASNPDNSDSGAVKTPAWRNAWNIPELTKLTDQAILIRDPERRAALYREIQRQVLEDSPFVILFQEVDLAVQRANVRGFTMGPSFDTVYYRDVVKDAEI
jgi:peptide/nickel transport system substrate-binding protein